MKRAVYAREQVSSIYYNVHWVLKTEFSVLGLRIENQKIPVKGTIWDGTRRMGVEKDSDRKNA